MCRKSERLQQKLFRTIKEFIKVAVYKINTQKSFVFLYTKYKIS